MWPRGAYCTTRYEKATAPGPTYSGCSKCLQLACLLVYYQCTAATELILSMIHDGIKFCRATQEGHLRPSPSGPPAVKAPIPVTGCQMRGDTPAATITRSKLSGSRAAPYLTTFGSCITSAVPVTYKAHRHTRGARLQTSKSTCFGCWHQSGPHGIFFFLLC